MVVIDPQQKPHRLRRQLDRTRRHQQRLQHILLQNVTNHSLPDVDTRALLSVCVTVPQFGDHGDRVETGVFGEGGRNHFERFGVRGEAVGFHALEGLGVLREEAGDVDFGGTTTGDEETVVKGGWSVRG